MILVPLNIAGTLLAASTLSASIATADASSPATTPTDYSVPLDESDLRMITLEVLKEHPLLSASPGIKAAYAMGAYSSLEDAKAVFPSMVMANVIFYPHTETGGIKQAFEAHCERKVSNSAWSCLSVQIRRYVKLDSQDYEVRVKGDLNLNGVIAVIEATRALAQMSVVDGSGIPDTAIMVLPANGGYVVAWGNKEGMGQATVEARLRNGGNSANPNDWRVGLLPES